MSEKINADKNFESSVGKTIVEADELNRRKTFSSREVGITHPDNPAFIRLTDSGDIEIFAAPGVGLVINGSTRTISIFADNIKLHTKDDGLHWNAKQFNSSATVFAEPALVPVGGFDFNPGFKNADYYINNITELDKEDAQQTVTIQGDYDYIANTDTAVWEENIPKDPSLATSGGSFSQPELDNIESFWKANSGALSIAKEEVINKFLKLKELGYNLEQAKARILEDNNV